MPKRTTAIQTSIVLRLSPIEATAINEMLHHYVSQPQIKLSAKKALARLIRRIKAAERNASRLLHDL